MGDRRQNFFHTALLMACCMKTETAQEATDLAMNTLEELGLLSEPDTDDQMQSTTPQP